MRFPGVCVIVKILGIEGSQIGKAEVAAAHEFQNLDNVCPWSQQHKFGLQQ